MCNAGFIIIIFLLLIRLLIIELQILKLVAQCYKECLCLRVRYGRKSMILFMSFWELYIEENTSHLWTDILHSKFWILSEMYCILKDFFFPINWFVPSISLIVFHCFLFQNNSGIYLLTLRNIFHNNIVLIERLKKKIVVIFLFILSMKVSVINISHI